MISLDVLCSLRLLANNDLEPQPVRDANVSSFPGKVRIPRTTDLAPCWAQGLIRELADFFGVADGQHILQVLVRTSNDVVRKQFPSTNPSY